MVLTQTRSIAWTSALVVFLASAWAHGAIGDRPVEPEAPTPAAAAEKLPTLMVGDKAPALQVEEWIKGEGVEAFKPGQVYMVEFFGSWCGACFESLPAVSALREKYDGKVRVLAVSIREGGPKDEDYTDATRAKVREFVKVNGERMRFTVGYDGGAKRSRTAWTDAAEQSGVPTAFVVDGAGRIAYIGHPAVERCGQVLEALVAGTFDMGDAKEKYATKIREEREFKRARKLFEDGKVDDSLTAFDALVKKSPKWGRTISFEKYQNLVQAKRYDAALKEAAESLDTHHLDSLGGLSVLTNTLLTMPAEFAERANALALRAARRAIEGNTENYPGPHSDLAGVYWKMGQREEAIASQRKAVELAPAEWKKNFEPKLREYEGK